MLSAGSVLLPQVSGSSFCLATAGDRDMAWTESVPTRSINACATLKLKRKRLQDNMKGETQGMPRLRELARGGAKGPMIARARRSHLAFQLDVVGLQGETSMKALGGRQELQPPGPRRHWTCRGADL